MKRPCKSIHTQENDHRLVPCLPIAYAEASAKAYRQAYKLKQSIINI